MAGDTSLFDAALACLRSSSPDEKIALTRQAALDHGQGRLPIRHGDAVEAVGNPGRPAKPRLVDARQLPRRGLGSVAGRAALMHAVAHIEFNAINLAWDAVYRFRDMPDAYYADWVAVASDEARHFGMVCERLEALGFSYGNFDAHNGLWDMAVRTAGSCLERMALVPRVLEARGLDVTPAMIERLRLVGDKESVALLEVILDEEVAHVAAGTRWFHWCCEHAGVEPDATFDQLVKKHLHGSVKGPFNVEARLAAGFSQAELDRMMASAA
ncbi:MAG: ferritin-like domain-containing protein [Dokdonella sp.]